MKVLVDDDLKALLTGPKPFIVGVPNPSDWFGRDSPVQPSSIDLHIGDIFLPEAKKGKRGSEDAPLREYVLKPFFPIL